MIKARCTDEDGNEPVWVSEVEAAAERVSIDNDPKQPEGLHFVKNDNRFYRVVFARCDTYTSGSRLCYILFLPRSPRNFDVRERTSILLSSLILSIRFRQRILAFTEDLQALPRKDKINGVLEIEKRLLQIETESVEFGLQMPADVHEEFPVVKVFREGKNKPFVQQSIVSWLGSRRVLADAFKKARIADPSVDRIQLGVEGADIVVKELKRYQQVNGEFIQVLTEELLFLEKVAGRSRRNRAGAASTGVSPVGGKGA